MDISHSQIAKFWNVNEVVVEANFGDGMFTKVITPIFNKIHPVAIQEVKNTKQKELRIIDTLEPVLMRHKLIVNKSVIENDYRRFETNQAYSFIYQMTRICRDKNAIAHDDRLDAVTMAVAYWLDNMDIDGEQSIKQGLEGDIEDWITVGILQKHEPRNACLKNVKVLRDVH